MLVNKGSQLIQPIFFAGVSTLCGGIVSLVISFFQRGLKDILNRKALLYACYVAFFISILHYSIMFVGAKMTTGINTSALLLFEIIFTLLITPFFGEKPTLYKTIGGLFVLAGAFIILFKGGEFHLGDLLIILSTISLPFGNHFGKKALQYISPANLLTLRYLLSGVVLLMFSFIFEDTSKMLPSIQNHWIYVVLNGFFLFGLINNIWYYGLKKLEISRAIPLLMTYPAFSLVFLAIFYSDIPNIFQISGVFIIIVGAFITSKKATA